MSAVEHRVILLEPDYCLQLVAERAENQFHLPPPFLRNFTSPIAFVKDQNYSRQEEIIMDLVKPFPGKNPGDQITKQELLSAIRLSICAEQEAVHLYDQIAEFTDNEMVKKLMTDVADEERVHIGEFTKLLELVGEGKADKVKEGEDEAAKKLGQGSSEESEPEKPDETSEEPDKEPEEEPEEKSEAIKRIANVISEDITKDNGIKR
jgi:rubrerythrin